MDTVKGWGGMLRACASVTHLGTVSNGEHMRLPGTGGLVHQLRALVAFVDDPVPDMHMVHMYTCRQNTCTYTINLFKFLKRRFIKKKPSKLAWVLGKGSLLAGLP